MSEEIKDLTSASSETPEEADTTETGLATVPQLT